MRTLFARLGREGTAGAFIVLIGVVLWLLVRDYPVGLLSEFGPGFVPYVASLALVALGSVMVVRALHAANDDAAPLIGRPLIFVPLGIGIFAFGLDRLGLALASALAVLVTGFASRESTLRERALVAVALAGLVTLTFGYGLSMTLPLWPAWLRP